MTGFPTPGDRRLEVPGTTNLRDVGGYPVTGGGRTRWGVLYRGDAARDVPGAFEAVRRLGIRTVVDLRPEAESSAVPTLWGRVPDVNLVGVPVPDGADGEATGIMERLRRGVLRRFDEDDLARFYIETLKRRAPEYGQAVAALGATDALPAVVQCAAGKDRTGLLVALVLVACGVERPAVLADFALTSRYRPNRLEDFRDELEQLGTVPEAVAAVFACPPTALAAALDSVEQHDGSVTAYLLGPAAVPAEALARLVAGLTEAG